MMCVCGCDARSHHASMKFFPAEDAMSAKRFAGYVYGGCLTYGSNEAEGMMLTWRGRLRFWLWNVRDLGRWVPGPWWTEHCFRFEEVDYGM